VIIQAAIIWIVAAIVIGFLGRHRRFGFWGYFFSTVLLTPVIGVLLLIAAIPPKPPRPTGP
jgi:hypothetical protein